MRRLEEEKKKARRQAIRSQLWRQRRKKDGKLIEVWKDTKKSLEEPDLDEDDDDPWLVELLLSDEERAALQQLVCIIKTH